MYPNNNQQMAYPVDRPLLQLMQYNPNQPPFVPNLQIAPHLQPYLPYLVGMMMNVITQGTQGPISMHFYNNMSKNNWANEDFVKEVHNCADYIYLKTQGQNYDPGQVIQRLVPAYVYLRARYEAKLFQYLWQYIDPADAGGFQQEIGTFEQEVAAIYNWRQGGTMGAQVPIGQPMMSGRYPAQPVNMGLPPSAMMAPVQMGGYTAPVTPARQGPGGGRDYGATQPSQGVQTMPQAAAPIVPATPAPAPAPAPAAPAPTAQPAVAAETLVEITAVKWNPSEKMPYPMAYNPIRNQMFYTIQNGKTVPQLVHNDEIDMINYDRHNIATLFGRPPENSPVVKDNSELVRRLAAGVRDAAEEEANVDETLERVEESMGLRAIVTVTSLEAAIQDVKCEMLAKIDREHPPMVFQAYSQIWTPILGETSWYELLRKFADSSSYVELREKVRAAGDTAPVELLTEVVLRLTTLMNSILHNNLSIDPSEITVDDFVYDLDELLGLLKREYGERVHKAFLKDQALRIKLLFGMPDVLDEEGRKLHDTLVENSLTSSWDGREDKPSMTFFGPTVRLSFINVRSHDLQLAGLAKVGNILTQQQHPALTDLAKQVFENTDEIAARQLVITKDGRILELHKANLVEGGYLVSLVK